MKRGQRRSGIDLQLYAQPTTSKMAARKRAQRIIPLTQCLLCGATEHLHRHHPNILSAPLDVVIVCQHCHRKMDDQDGTRLDRIQPKKCVVCHQMFLPKRSRAMLCGMECIREMGRMTALKRWR